MTAVPAGFISLVEYDQEQLTYLFSAIRLFCVLIAEIPWFHFEEEVQLSDYELSPVRSIQLQ